jgi:hypothetical protein
MHDAMRLTDLFVYGYSGVPVDVGIKRYKCLTLLHSSYVMIGSLQKIHNLRAMLYNPGAGVVQSV